MTYDLPFAKVAREVFDRIYHRIDTKQRFYDILYSSFRDVDARHPQEVLDLLYRCLNPDPEGRPSIFEFECCEWIRAAPDDLDDDLRNELEALYNLAKHPSDN